MAEILHRSERMRILGLMTGSSADGLDLCLVEFTGHDTKPDFKVCYTGEIKYPSNFSDTFRNPLAMSETDIRQFDALLGKWFADEIQTLDLKFDSIASHGQTIKHNPPHFTLQIGDPGFMADRFKVPVIYDFRSADIELGGQGAPLIPVVDRFLLQEAESDVLSLNIGGISNISVIPSTNSTKDILAWDTGPGNTLIDKAVRLYSNNKLNFDPDGSLAAKGNINSSLLNLLLSHEFYRAKPPRSAGQEQFGHAYFNQVLNQFKPTSEKEYRDFIKTFTVLTAMTITDSIKHLREKYSPTTLYVSGGGTHNKTLMSELSMLLPDLKLSPVDHKGVNTDNKEAFGFAYLGYCYLNNIPGNIPSVTGAHEELILGKSYSLDT
ncbi:MAG: anhydro-N-acetylmuramic acid kinase [Candidatus Marinimicrobia bacterium]|nr:anhydro-N-acetylmuramic acid kinase [Candidatus Neomarinimicrobiota bacterium]